MILKSNKILLSSAITGILGGLSLGIATTALAADAKAKGDSKGCCMGANSCGAEAGAPASDKTGNCCGANSCFASKHDCSGQSGLLMTKAECTAANASYKWHVWPKKDGKKQTDKSKKGKSS